MKYYNIPKDLLEDIEIQTGKTYDIESNDLKSVYQEALIDTYELLITLKLNTRKLLTELNK